jgi:PAT family beta-lactamase induction signal transducer AmpG
MTYTLLAAVGHNYGLMVVAVIVENVCAGMGIAAYTALIMSLCDRRFTISQYALFTGVMALSRTMAGTMSGYMAKQVGWVWFFTIATVISAPGLLLLLRFNKWQMPQLVSRATEE